MDKLREKFNPLLENRIYNYENVVDELEQITDDFTIKFLEWLNENSIYYPKDKQYFFNNEWHSQEEIFKHFKNNIYEN
jgi:hypothetical protein